MSTGRSGGVARTSFGFRRPIPVDAALGQRILPQFAQHLPRHFASLAAVHRSGSGIAQVVLVEIQILGLVLGARIRLEFVGAVHPFLRVQHFPGYGLHFLVLEALLDLRLDFGKGRIR